MEDIPQNKSNIYIVGAGGFGREIESWLGMIPEEQRTWRLIGYIDDNPNALEGFPTSYKVLGKIEDFKFMPNDKVLLAIADPDARENAFQILNQRVELFTFVHPNAIIGKFTSIGEGSIICPNTIISTNCKVGKCVIINIGSNIGHDCEINNFCSIMANVDIGGNSVLGEGIFIGSGSTIIPQRKIVDGVKIGAGSVVVRNIKKLGTYFGNPSAPI